MKKTYLIKLAIIAALVLIVYIPVFIWMFDRWNVAGTYYSHGILIPFISLFIVWQKRKELAKTNIKPTRKGWLLFIPGILVYILSALWSVYFSSGFSLLLVIPGLSLLFLGKQFLRKLLFPIFFLIFMIPLPEVAIANMSFRLKILASQIAVFLVRLTGLSVIREGSVIKTAHSYLVVEDPCSGIRSLIALIALGTLMAYFSRLSRTKKVILFLSSVPIAIFSNVIRIAVLTLVSEMYGAKIATGSFHDAMGFVVFVIAFFSLVLVGKVLE
ncbi:MAG: exosortase/archaeosortase family protein [Candidatus Omnitrophica bacterium]|nr:exosortase/archaeosortase family protein [Candidatus Omnitrophota bacterium]